MNTEKNTKEKYDTQDDYYYTVINNIEINIRGYKKDRISLWIYDHNTEIELNHTLRHTFASHLAINGVSLFEIQKLLNHKDINMTMRYMKLAEQNKVNAVEGIY